MNDVSAVASFGQWMLPQIWRMAVVCTICTEFIASKGESVRIRIDTDSQRRWRVEKCIWEWYPTIFTRRRHSTKPDYFALIGRSQRQLRHLTEDLKRPIRIQQPPQSIFRSYHFSHVSLIELWYPCPWPVASPGNEVRETRHEFFLSAPPGIFL